MDDTTFFARGDAPSAPARGREKTRPNKPALPHAKHQTKEARQAHNKTRAAPEVKIPSERHAFRCKWYPQASDADWNNWRWQLKNIISGANQADTIFALTTAEKMAFKAEKKLPIAITPYYASVIWGNGNKRCSPLRKAVIPCADELIISSGESEDPLAENEQSPVPCIVHRYPDRVLFLTTNSCASYCRYCTRSRFVGQESGQGKITRATWEKCIRYIEEHTEIRDVLLSGGDPLLLPEMALKWLLKRIRSIKHVEIIRIGTKAPVVLPQKITPSLIRILKQFHPLLISIHFTHPDELTPETEAVCGKLADAGILLGSQTVLLARINDDAQVMMRLMRGLLKIRVKPYYLYQCDPILGSAHFRTPVRRGVEIINKIQGHTSGYAVPSFVIDAPEGGGKIPVNPQFVVGNRGKNLLLKNYKGELYQYPDTIRDID